jgi:glyoxylase-like metal-dependent hydrolase (beta-lactamase superfamily II)
MLFRQLAYGTFDNFQYVFGSEETGEGALVDPGFGAEEIADHAEEMGLDVTHILVTHAHSDHIAEVDIAQEATGADVVAYEDAEIRKDVVVGDGDRVEVGGIPVDVHHTPGHSADHVIFEAAGEYLFTGDLLFVQECGRVDLDGSDPEAMYASFFEVLAGLDPELVVCPGHDYGPEPRSTLGKEFETNYVLEDRDLDDFVEFMLADPA